MSTPPRPTRPHAHARPDRRPRLVPVTVAPPAAAAAAPEGCDGPRRYDPATNTLSGGTLTLDRKVGESFVLSVDGQRLGLIRLKEIRGSRRAGRAWITFDMPRRVRIDRLEVLEAREDGPEDRGATAAECAARVAAAGVGGVGGGNP